MLNPEISQNLPVKELTNALTAHLIELVYRQRTMKDYKCVFNRLIDYCEAHNIEFFTKELESKFAWEHYGMDIPNR